MITISCCQCGKDIGNTWYYVNNKGPYCYKCYRLENTDENKILSDHFKFLQEENQRLLREKGWGDVLIKIMLMMQNPPGMDEDGYRSQPSDEAVLVALEQIGKIHACMNPPTRCVSNGESGISLEWKNYVIEVDFLGSVKHITF
jgi:DNA-directed RNA polymerase subunit N (RpoN/RPB10)